ncbi:MAG TPA: ABC transporter permease [Polyangiaceae bacterium]|nr:ABC transporter permease [Polyangiaceae bacterium]
MTRVGRALILHELLERTRDRWVVVITLLFAALASGVSLYGQSAEGNAAALTGPSLVTLAAFLVPLVALVLGHDAIVGESERNTLGLLLSLPVSRIEVVVAKFIGRGIALCIAVGLGLSAAMLTAGEGEAGVLAKLIGPSLLLGLAFVSFGILISSVTSRQVTAASLVVVTWFLFVFFYDVGLLGLLVATDGEISQQTIASLVVGNPAGLYRVQMMTQLAGPEVMEGLGLSASLPTPTQGAAIWAAWILGPLGLSGLVLSAKKVLR